MAIAVRKKYILLSILLIIASVNFTRTAYDILRSSKRLDDLEAEVNSLDSKKQQLQKEIDRKKTPDYVEEKARNELNMIKPGEKIVVFVNKTIGKDTSGTYVELPSTNVLAASSNTIKDTTPNFQRWINLFFKKK